MFRRAMKRAVGNAMRLGALGIKVNVARPPERRRDRAFGVVPRRSRAAAHAARRHRLRLRRGDDAPTGSSASRSGSTRAKSSTSARSARKSVEERNERPARPAQVTRGKSPCCNPNAPSSASSIKGRNRRPELDRRGRQLRRVRPEGDRARPADRAPDRGGPPLDQPLRQARRQAVDPRVPGQADHQEADRSPHGRRQGQRRVSGWRRSSRAGCCMKSRASRKTTAREAFRLAAAKLSVKTTFVTGRCCDGNQGTA